MNAGKPKPRIAETDRRLLEFLVCPLTRGPLQWDAEKQELVSQGARIAYPIRGGIPIMLASEARKIENE
jgi:hypothetical protein